MKGKTVGVVSVGGSTEQLLDIMLRAVGMTKADVSIKVVGNSPGVLQFVRQGRIDCFINSVGVVVALQTAGEVDRKLANRTVTRRYRARSM